MSLYFLTFGNSRYYQAIERICKQAIEMNIFNQIIYFTDNDLKNDKEFWNQHGDFINNNNRGYGYWIWKSYLIHKIMVEKMDYGDIILYSDAGCELNKKGIKRLGEYIELTKKNGNLLFNIPYMEQSWTKMDLIDKLDAYQYTNTNQIMSGIQFYVKNDRNIMILKEIYDTCCSENYHFVDDSPSHLENDQSFVEHRHDQSILSLIAKKNGLFNIKDETYYHPEWNRGILYPILSARNITSKGVFE